MNKMEELVAEYNRGYDEGLAEGLKTAEFSDAYWFRTYAGRAMQGILPEAKMSEDIGLISHNSKIIAEYAVKCATALLAQIKKAEAENENIR